MADRTRMSDARLKEIRRLLRVNTLSKHEDSLCVAIRDLLAERAELQRSRAAEPGEQAGRPELCEPCEQRANGHTEYEIDDCEDLRMRIRQQRDPLVCLDVRAAFDRGHRAGHAAGSALLARVRELLSTLVYWHDQGHVDESWWDEARKLAAPAAAKEGA